MNTEEEMVRQGEKHMSKPMSDFQRQFLSKGTGQQLFTENEFNEKLSIKIAEVMAVAIDTSKTAVMIERQACADIVKEAGHEELSEKILNRIPTQRQ